MKKKVDARLSIQIYVDCPHCELGIDLFDAFDAEGVTLDGEGFVSLQAFPDGAWGGKNWESFSVEDVRCSRCGKSFDVKGLLTAHLTSN